MVLIRDNVILLNFNNNIIGFPNKISDDPILELVLSSSDDYLFAEERRLMYVALTRTRNKIYILTDKNNPSIFYNELKHDRNAYINSQFVNDKEKEEIPCPKCKTGYLMRKVNPKSGNMFIGCSHYPKCDYSLSDTKVFDENIKCPLCGGFLIRRKSKIMGKPPFYGCTNYPFCNYIRTL